MNSTRMRINGAVWSVVLRSSERRPRTLRRVSSGGPIRKCEGGFDRLPWNKLEKTCSVDAVVASHNPRRNWRCLRSSRLVLPRRKFLRRIILPTTPPSKRRGPYRGRSHALSPIQNQNLRLWLLAVPPARRTIPRVNEPSIHDESRNLESEG